MNGEIRQIGLVFKDFSEKIENIKSILDISEVNIFDVKVRKDIHKEKLENQVKIKLGITTIGNIQLEFIQPLEGKTIYDEFLEEKGGGIHHIGIYVENLEEHIKKLESKGIKQLWNANVAGARIAYFDTMDQIGFITELIEVKVKKSG
ncbi:MAG: VOC family protein [Candidatus Helarchaeota archaeon]